MTSKLVPLIAFVLAMGLLAAPVAKAGDATPFTAMADHYEAVWKALSGDSLDGVSIHAQAIAEIAQAETHPADAREAVPEIVEHARSLADAATLDAARDAFGKLTKPLVRYRKAVGADHLNVAYCPMLQKAWLQPEGDLANPYYGSEMLTCGEIVES